MANKKVLHKRSNIEGKAPTSDQLDYGELAINYNKGNEQLYIKNSEDDIVPLINSVTVSGTTPLTLTATTTDGKTAITGSVDAYDTATIDEKLACIVSGGTLTLEGYLKKTEAEETYQPIGSYLTSLTASGVSPLTLTSTTDTDGKTTLLGSVDLSSKQDVLIAGDNINIDDNNVISTKVLPFDEIYSGNKYEISTTPKIEVPYKVVYGPMSRAIFAVAQGSELPFYTDWDADDEGHVSKDDYCENGNKPYEWKIYSCNGVLYTWNGSDLVPFGNLSEDGLLLLSYRYKYTYTYNFLESVKSLFTYIPTYVSIDKAQIMDVAEDENSCRIRITISVDYSAGYNFIYVTLGNYTVAVCPPFNRTSTSYVSFDLILQIVDGVIQFPAAYQINATTWGGVVGDAVYYDSTIQKMIFVKPENISADSYPLSRYTPIGVVAIPASHDVYGTGECGVVSLKYMSCDTPDEGSISMESIYWGWYVEQVRSTLYNYCVNTGTFASPTTEASGEGHSGYLPSESLTGTQCPTDPKAYYYGVYSGYEAAPSPYLEDGSRNPVYYQTTSPTSTANCLSDFDGVGGTQLMLDKVTVSDWKTSSTITNTTLEGNYPSACCCWRYHTNGTSQGDWYLPACGELGYVLVRLNTINNTISNLIDAYGSDIGGTIGDTHVSGNGLLTCTEYSAMAYKLVNLSDGQASYYNKTTYRYIRAFYRVKVLYENT